MFGKSFRCIDCIHYGGTLSDGRSMCMEKGPIRDIICCKNFSGSKEINQNNKTKKENTPLPFDCRSCLYFNKSESSVNSGTGECTKFPGKIFNGEKRKPCVFFK